MLKKVVLVAAVCVLAMSFIAPLMAADEPDRVRKLSIDWWCWVLDIPLASNPKIDPDGRFAHIGQSDGAGDVWFLCDSFGDPPPAPLWVREVEVPEGRPLFFPITDCVFWKPEDGKSVKDLRALCNAAMDGATTLECTVDGVPLETLLGLDSLYDLRLETRPFQIPDTLLVDFGLDPGKRLSVAEGYWVYLDPLPVGEHVINIYMEMTAGPFAPAEQDVTWIVTVVAE